MGAYGTYSRCRRTGTNSRGDRRKWWSPGRMGGKGSQGRAAISRIQREIETARKLHEQGAPVIEIIDDYLRSAPEASRAWFVMPIAEGGSLGDHLQSQPIYGGSVVSALELFRAIAAAVLQFHKQDVAHRDLKPDNILLTAESKPLLADLGLCLPLGDTDSERLTGVLERIGSLHYLPKEAFGIRPLDQNQFAFDAYALGKILYQMVSGRMLPGFTSPTDPQFDLTKHENSPLLRGVSRAIRGLLHDTPAVRLATLSQLEEQLGDLLEATKEERTQGTEAMEILMKAAGALAAQLVTSPSPAPAPRDLQYELDSICDEIFALRSQSPILREIERVLVQPNSDRIEVAKEPANRTLRNVLVGPGINTRRALEPIEDLGYPSFPIAESGCAIKVSGKAEASKTPTVYLAALVGSRNSRVMVAAAIAVCSPEPLGARDVARGTAVVVDVTVHDAALGGKLRGIADAAIQKFATTLAAEISQKR